MKKMMLSVIIGSVFAFYTSGVFAATARCSVIEITDNMVILDCGKSAVKIKVGDKVKVKTAKKKTAVEGC